MVALALRWMFDPESPFHLKLRASADLVDWGWKFYRACTEEHVAQSAPLLRDLHLASRAHYEVWAAQWGNRFDFVDSGMLVLCRTEHGLEEEARIAKFARDHGMSANVVSAKDVAEIEPGIRMTVAGAIHFPLDARLVPGRLMSALRDETQRIGAELRHGVEVRGFRVNGARIAAVETTDGTLAADEVVLCAGIWSSSLARKLGLSLPMQAGKGYSLTVEKPAQTMRACAILSEARAAVTPMGGTLRFGGTMEITGNDESVDSRRVRGMVKSIGTYFPDMTPDVLAGATIRTGLRPCSPDGLPYIGRFAHYANLSAATGHAMMGVSLAPITGTLIAQVLCGEPTSIPIAALSPDRYARPHVEATKERAVATETKIG
jgi:D-amino-acid dehydrogenase